MIDWNAIETWNVGDVIDAETWTTRWYEPMSLMLRKPLTQVRCTSQFYVSSGVFYTNSVPWDTVDQDDDDMVVEDTPFTTLVAQRSGVFDVYVAVPFVSNGASGYDVIGIELMVNDSATHERSGRIIATTNADLAKGLDGSLRLTEGDTLKVALRNATASNVYIQPYYNAPRLTVIWRGPLSM